MPNLNKVMLMGNLTRDPEIKYTPKGTAIASFGLAVNRVFTPEGGERREEVTFVDIEAYGKQAETIGEYCKKGKPLYIEGRLKLDSWDDKQTGQKRTKMKVILEGFQFLGTREGGGQGGPGGGGPDADYADSHAGESSRPSAGGGGGGAGSGGGGGYSGGARRPPASAPRPPADPDLDAAPDDIPF
jgi:single-strand DNA-binding protein